MMVCNDVYLNRVAAFLPNRAVGNDEMETVLGRVGGVPSRVRKMILRANGIRSRHYAIDPDSRAATHTAAELAAEAVRGLWTQGVRPDEVSVLACATSYPDQIMPGHGVMVHGLLPEIPPCEVATAAGVCTAGMTAMLHAFRAVCCNGGTAVACAAENASAVMRGECFAPAAGRDWDAASPELAFEQDFLRWMLSDGAGAAALSAAPLAGSLNFKIRWIETVSYAGEMPVCMYAGADTDAQGRLHGFKSGFRADNIMAVKQNVKLLNAEIIARTVEQPLRRLADKYALAPERIDWFLPHYSSEFFRPRVAAGLQRIGFALPQEKWFTNLAEKGNTGSASIYIILEEFMRRGDVCAGETVLCYIPESGRFSSCFMLLEAVYAD
ncbi:StlD/DarB family beta-ketosynthase [Conchiformibius kuhniae]|uniref:StlD/DarB family beta-ketosynthase n=1 Tax=Conchiformibius kuhniae TaxID=211502 RepID=A0A8T9MWH3_9NEIS|nr:StlD/DarB family beta-ketosynthase [Conchiformibius kuhniae]